MALARIISNSPLCSRELALNLLERGYAVEIVSPDAIPDNLADLELRVETGPADLLSARVEARGETRSASLQFIHQLKSPSLQVKRPPRDAQAIAVPDLTIPALAISGNPPPPLAISPTPLTAMAACEPIPISGTPDPAVGPLLVETEFAVEPPRPNLEAVSADPPKKPAAFSDAGLVVMPSPSQEAVQEAAQSANEDDGIHSMPVLKVVIPRPSLPSWAIAGFQLRSAKGLFTRCKGWVRRAAYRPARWLGWTALGFAGLMALGLTLELASVRMSHPAHASAPSVPIADTAPAIDGFSLLPPIVDEKNNIGEIQPNSFPGNKSSVGNSATPQTAPPVSGGNAEQSGPTSKLAAGPTPKIAKSAHRSMRVRHSADLVAPDTITYFDRPGAKPVPVKQLVREHADSRKHGDGVVAANSSAKTISQTGLGK